MNKIAKKYNYAILASLIMMLLFAFCGQAQTRHKKISSPTKGLINSRIQEHISTIYTATADSIESTINKYRYSTQKDNILNNPYFFPLFIPNTYFQAPIHRLIGTLQKKDIYRSYIDTVQTNIDSTLAEAYSTKPWFVYRKDDIQSTNRIESQELIQEVRPQVKLSDKTPSKNSIDDNFAKDWQIIVRKPNFWNFKTNISLQLMQNYISDNWYKGGESNYSWLVQMNLEATYNNKQKIVFNNTLESKLGFLSTKNDEKHKFRTNADMLRMTNKLGLRATKHWYYTIMLQSWTQFYHGYRSNDTKVYSDFMSPFESIFSIGMDYNLSVKKFNMSATISPIAADLKYVDRKYLATSFGIDKDKHSKLSYGSNITIKYNWTICKNVSWNSRIYYYTDYSKAQLEWENTFNMKINKYLTTQLFLYPRFDDSVGRKEGDSYLQFKEFLSFGLNLTF